MDSFHFTVSGPVIGLTPAAPQPDGGLAMNAGDGDDLVHELLLFGARGL